jgi:hypothetical protein
VGAVLKIVANVLSRKGHNTSLTSQNGHRKRCPFFLVRPAGRTPWKCPSNGKSSAGPVRGTSSRKARASTARYDLMRRDVSHESHVVVPHVRIFAGYGGQAPASRNQLSRRVVNRAYGDGEEGGPKAPLLDLGIELYQKGFIIAIRGQRAVPEVHCVSKQSSYNDVPVAVYCDRLTLIVTHSSEVP